MCHQPRVQEQAKSGGKSLCAQISSMSSSFSVSYPGLWAVGCGRAQARGRQDLTPLALLGRKAYPQEKGAGQKVS